MEDDDDDDEGDEDDDEDDDDDEEEEEEEEEDSSDIVEERVPTPKNAGGGAEDELDTDQETDRLLGQQYNDDNGYYDQKVSGDLEGARARSAHMLPLKILEMEVKSLRRKHPGDVDVLPAVFVAALRERSSLVRPPSLSPSLSPSLPNRALLFLKFPSKLHHYPSFLASSPSAT